MPNRVKDIYALFAALALLMVLFISPQARADDAPAATQAGDSGTWRFRVYLDDHEIGYHHFHLAGTGDHRQLRSEARFEYRLLFLKLFDYEHENLETWSGDCLQSIRSRTDANGDMYAVEGRLTKSGFRIEAGEEAGSLPDCVMTFAYWNPDFLEQSRLLNSQDGSFVPSPVVGRHDDGRFGTHHARDAWHLFNTMGYDLNLFSSAIKLNTQYMHTIFFDIRVKTSTTVDRLTELMERNDKIALTHKKTANQVFSFGRDHGHYGRILNVTVVVLPTLTVRTTWEGAASTARFSRPRKRASVCEAPPGGPGSAGKTCTSGSSTG